LGLQLEVDGKLIQFTELQSGQRLLHPSELDEALKQEQQRADQAQQRANQEQQRANQAQQRAEKLAAKLKALGIDPVE